MLKNFLKRREISKKIELLDPEKDNQEIKYIFDGVEGHYRTFKA